MNLHGIRLENYKLLDGIGVEKIMILCGIRFENAINIHFI